MANDELSLGEYIRRLRKKKGWQLSTLAEKTGLSYHHLSRIENDSSVPGADSVALIADALGGDLKLMLEMADCLPKQILDRISSREEAATPKMARTAGPGAPAGARAQAEADVLRLVQRFGVAQADQASVADALVRLLRLDCRRQRAVVNLMKQFGTEEGDGG